MDPELLSDVMKTVLEEVQSFVRHWSMDEAAEKRLQRLPTYALYQVLFFFSPDAGRDPDVNARAMYYMKRALDLCVQNRTPWSGDKEWPFTFKE